MPDLQCKGGRCVGGAHKKTADAMAPARILKRQAKRRVCKCLSPLAQGSGRKYQNAAAHQPLMIRIARILDRRVSSATDELNLPPPLPPEKYSSQLNFKFVRSKLITIGGVQPVFSNLKVV